MKQQRRWNFNGVLLCTAFLFLWVCACTQENSPAVTSNPQSDAVAQSQEEPINSETFPSLFSEDKEFRLPRAYRFDERLSEAIVRESHHTGNIEEKRLVLWPPPDTSWFAEGEEEAARREEDVLHFTTSGPASVTLAEGLQLDAPSVDAIRLHIAVEGADRIRLAWRFAPVDWDFCTKEGNCWIWTPVQGDGIEHTYVVRVGDMDRWLQFRVIDGIQLLTEGAATVRIHGVEISSRKGLFAQHDIGVR